ncbi:MAG: NEW3 domain-containing protein [Armatimonadota bacterium]|nr:NEW3 domain-containing protein [Armatimonadota bacterium]
MNRTWLAQWLVIVLAVGMAALPAAAGFQGLRISTPYPSQAAQVGEAVTLSLTVKNFGLPPQSVALRVVSAPPGWKATFLGGGRPIQSVFVDPDQENTISLRLEPPRGVRPGTYRFTILASGQNASATLPITLTLGAVLPRRLSLSAELPVLRGSPTSSFRYRLTLRNESDQEVLVNLDADAPQGFRVTFSTFGQEVASLPIKAGESKDFDAEVSLPPRVAAGTYPITVRAVSGDATATLQLSLEVTGRPDLTVTTPDDRLSGRATAGRTTPLKLKIKNTGSAPARSVTFSASEPSGWEVKFVPERVDEIPANGEADVTAEITPSAKALTGDYMVTITASAGDVSRSADFRITVTTSTLWGAVGVVLVAVALGVVTFAVNRYGRR